MSLSQPDRSVQDKIVAAARAWLGTPYRHQASVRGIGCDCLGLVRGVWRDCLGPEPEPAPPYAASWAESAAPGTDPLAQAAGRHLVPVPLGEAQAGDILLFAFRAHLPARHCAIVADQGAGHATMIHAHDGAAVTEVALTRWWLRHRTHAFRFPARPVATGG